MVSFQVLLQWNNLITSADLITKEGQVRSGRSRQAAVVLVDQPVVQHLLGPREGRVHG
jgi:hypothetical protein